MCIRDRTRSITKVKYHQLTWYNSLWLWRWLPHRLSKRHSLSTTTVPTRTTFTWTIKLNLVLHIYLIHLFIYFYSYFFLFSAVRRAPSAIRRPFPYFTDTPRIVKMHFTEPAWLSWRPLIIVSNGQNAVVKSFDYVLHHW